ncbi:MAG: ribokinase [Clostridia bacterium]|nr:ribokinase [Clostridia bacterium]
MKFLVFGSMNIDRVYSLDRLPEKGETLSCSNYELHVGGKGLNQAVSLAKAGALAYMAGRVGKDGMFLVDFLKKNGVNTDFIELSDGFSGHAVIEVDGEGQNQMILFPGANREITPDACERVLEHFGSGDLLLMQYETSQVEYMIQRAHKKGMKVALNPSPYVKKLKEIEYSQVDYLILNEFEGMSITGETEAQKIAIKLSKMLDGGAVILTLGADGAIYACENEYFRVPAFETQAVDTTGAGDTFTGFCLYGLMSGIEPEKALITASAASAIAVSRAGAAETIPDKKAVEDFLEKNFDNGFHSVYNHEK